MKIEFYKHNIGKKEKKELDKVLRSIFLTTGNVTKKFEDKFSKYMKIKNTIGVTSCTAGLHISLVALGIGKGDEVITTPMSFIATSNAIEYVGAKPVFVDVELNTGNIDAALIEKAVTSKTKAIIVTHLYGVMCDIKKINKIAKKFNLKLIEDSAHAIESKRDGIKPGRFSDAACFSFYATKNMTSGEGGAVITNNDDVAEKLRKLRLHGMSKIAVDRYISGYKHYDMELLGYKYNMFDIQAALLLNQLNNIEKYFEKRKKIYNRYIDKFFNVSNILLPHIPENCKSAYHIFTIWVDPDKRDYIINELQNRGIMVAVNFRPIHLMRYYRDKYNYTEGMFPNAEKIGSSTITLPFYIKLTPKEIDFICDTLIKIVS